MEKTPETGQKLVFCLRHEDNLGEPEQRLNADTALQPCCGKLHNQKCGVSELANY